MYQKEVTFLQNYIAEKVYQEALLVSRKVASSNCCLCDFLSDHSHYNSTLKEIPGHF